MKIAVLGNGAMGTLFGSYLSTANDVTLVGVIKEQINDIQVNGTTVREKDGDKHFTPKAIISGEGDFVADLIICFVKGFITETTLTENKNLIGPDTYILTFQNGAGHESIIGKFVDEKHILIGTTQHNAAFTDGVAVHGGWGLNTLGRVDGSIDGLERIADAFNASGFETVVSKDVQLSIWHKLLTNTSVSSATAVLQCSMHYLIENEYAWNVVKALLKETIETARVSGFEFNYDEELDKLKKLCEAATPGYTSIYTDVKLGRTSEVDRISGYVVSQAKKYNISVPCQEMVVNAIHAMETKGNN